MSKTIQIMKLTYKGFTYSVIKHNDDSVNPYWLYLKYRNLNRYGRFAEHKKLLVKYANMSSILYYLVNTYDFNE